MNFASIMIVCRHFFCGFVIRWTMCEMRGKQYNLFTKRVIAGSPESSEWCEQQNLTNNLVVREQEMKGL